MSPRAQADDASHRLTMFDNEIDWVTHWKSWFVRREAHTLANDFECVKKYKAEHMRVSGKLLTQASVQLKSVFRRYGNCARAHRSSLIGGEIE